MKIKGLIAFLFITPFLLAGQDICKGYYAFEEGTSWTMTTYNKNKKKTGSAAYEVLFNEVENGIQTTTFTFEIFDKNNEKTNSGEFTGTCQNNTFTTSFNGFFGETMPQSADIEVEISGDFIQYPSTMTAGQKLPDAQIVIASRIENGLALFKVTNDITNRKVIGFEKIVTPAGTFDCVKISYDAKIKMLITRSLQVVEYMAVGVGIVRSEQYDKKGELTGFTEISSFTKK
jgi:hypothetical protein